MKNESGNVSKTDYLKDIFGEKLQDLRLEKKMRLKQLEDKTGISAATLSNYENGKSMPPLDVLYKLLVAFDVSLAAFFHEKEMDFAKDKEVFAKYGLGDSFFETMYIEKQYQGYPSNGITYNIPENLNIIFDNSLDSPRFFQALDCFFNFELNKRISQCLGDNKSHFELQKDCGSVFISMMASALFDIFKLHHKEEENDAMQQLHQQIHMKNTTRIESCMDVLINEAQAKKTDAP